MHVLALSRLTTGRVPESQVQQQPAQLQLYGGALDWPQSRMGLTSAHVVAAPKEQGFEHEVGGGDGGGR